MRLRSLLGASALLVTALATTLATVPASSAAAAGGEDRIDQIAQANNMSRAKLLRLMEDDSFRIGVNDHAYYVDPLPTRAAASESVVSAAPFPLTDTFLLHSFPGSERTIYLDFDGQAVSGTGWNDPPDSVPAGTHPPFSLDADPAFSDAEKEMVQNIWQRVSEDYAPFNVDVTTEDPPAASLLRSSAGDSVYGVRALISPSTSAAGAICGNACGGVAYLNVFDDATFAPTFSGYYQPAWVFPHLLGNDAKNIAEATTHEVGHNLSLSHDGRFVPAEGYFAGQDNWAPIMGVGYYEPIVQWSKGEYTSANNTEDDIALISAPQRTPFRTDEAGGTFGTAAAALPVGSAYIHERTDLDVFALGTCTGTVTLDADPAAVSPNLDIQLRLLDSAGAQVAIANPTSAQVSTDVASGMDAAISTPVTTGTYYAEVDGVGKGLATASYNDYGSIGAYTLTGTGCGVADVAPVVTLDPAPQTVTEGQNAVFTAAATGTPTPTVQWQEDNGGGFANLVGETSTTLTLNAVTLAMNGYDYRAVFTNTAGSATSAAANLTVNPIPPVAPSVTLQPVDQSVFVGEDATFTAAASGTPTPTVQWQEDSGAGFADMVGETSTTLTLVGVTAGMDGNQYRAVFTNTAGSATTNAATLTVITAICDETTVGKLSKPGTSQVAKSFYTQPGHLDGCLTGPAGTDFDLYLQYQTRSGWVIVASGATPGTSAETVVYEATQAGYYRWVVYDVSGSGGYTLKFSRP